MKDNEHSIRQKAGILHGGDRQDNLPARMEMIERGRRLLANPDYPDLSACRELAGRILPMLY